jgi:hypothetical protein
MLHPLALFSRFQICRQTAVPRIKSSISSFVAHVVLEGSGVMPIVGELVTSGVPEHVRVNREWELGSFSGPSDHLQESCCRGWTASLGNENVSRFRILPT